MKTDSRQFNNEANEVTELKRRAKAVILYDDSAILPAAKRYLNRVEPNGGRRTEWMVHSWQFGMLRLKHRLEAYRAMEESADADVVVIAIYDPTSWAGLPVAWLGLWWDYRRSQAARLMVTSFDQVRKRYFAPPIGALRQKAEVRELLFPVWCGVAPDEDPEGNSRTGTRMTEVAGFSEKLAVKRSECLRDRHSSATC